MSDQKLNIDQEALYEMLKDIFTLTEETQKFMKVQAGQIEYKNMALTTVMESYETKIAALLEKRPASVNRQFRVLLFPETNAGEYYKIVFGRLIPWSILFIVIIFAGYFISLGIKGYNAHQANINGNVTMVAWMNAYEHASKSQKIIMDQALKNAVIGQ
jgi:hypothetical protein